MPEEEIYFDTVRMRRWLYLVGLFLLAACLAAASTALIFNYWLVSGAIAMVLFMIVFAIFLVVATE